MKREVAVLGIVILIAAVISWGIYRGTERDRARNAAGTEVTIQLADPRFGLYVFTITGAEGEARYRATLRGATQEGSLSLQAYAQLIQGLHGAGVKLPSRLLSFDVPWPAEAYASPYVMQPTPAATRDVTADRPMQPTNRDVTADKPQSAGARPMSADRAVPADAGNNHITVRCRESGETASTPWDYCCSSASSSACSVSGRSPPRFNGPSCATS